VENVPDLNCRVSKVEQQIESLLQDIHQEREESRRRSDRIFLALDELKKDSANNRGFFGGIVFAVGAIFAVVAYVFGKG
jgi:VIT1/CCC1 family predicted Fe2+/Mn2+ transporter